MRICFNNTYKQICFTNNVAENNKFQKINYVLNTFLILKNIYCKKKNFKKNEKKVNYFNVRIN